jgi:Putative zinc-finger
MSERDDKKPSGEPARVLRCDEWEDLIADALDGNLNAADAAAFARHHKECALCAQMFKETQQGRAWMEYLAVEPEVPAELLAKILARTSGPIEPGAAPPVHPVAARPAWHGVPLPLLRQAARQAFEPRLMMTLAMAFFSIALTLNLTGIRLTEVRAADLRPSRVRATLTRQYYSTNEQVMKYYENLRVVYEMEARVRELRRSTEAEPAAVESPRPSPSQAPKRPERDGTGPRSTAPSGRQALPVPQGRRAPLRGEMSLPATIVQAAPPPGAALRQPMQVPADFDPAGRKEKIVREVFRASRSTTEDQAERSLV